MKNKILIASKFYYTRGGAEVVAINMANDLSARGFEVGIFTMEHPENIKTDKFYTASEVNFSSGIMGKLKFAYRTLGFGDIKSSFKRALKEFNPDIVHIHNIHSYLSPIIVKLAKQHGCKVVWTLHDYKLLCPAYSCLNNGVVCEKCFNDKGKILKEKCFKGSLIASTLAYIEAKKWNRDWIERYVDYFVCPSSFIASQMSKGGFAKDKLKVICNFVDPIKLEGFKNNKVTEKEDYFVYVGRLSSEKGVATLLEAASHTHHKLKIAGGGPLKDELMAKYANCSNIEFLGHLSPEKVSELLLAAKATISPSECYENNPLSVIESLCAGTPVIGAQIGGIPELITDETGLTFPSGDINALTHCIDQIMTSDKYNYEEIAKSSQQRFSFETHFEKLEELYR